MERIGRLVRRSTTPIIIIVIIVIVMMQTSGTLLYFTVPFTDRLGRIGYGSCFVYVGTLSRCTVGFDFEDLGNIEFFVIWVGLHNAVYGIIISY